MCFRYIWKEPDKMQKRISIRRPEKYFGSVKNSLPNVVATLSRSFYEMRDAAFDSNKNSTGHIFSKKSFPLELGMCSVRNRSIRFDCI